MSVLDLIKKSRSYRRFNQSIKVESNDLDLMIEAARLSPSSRNIQPIKYIVCNDPCMNEKIFPNLAWAGYLTDWDGPSEGERPCAYIIQLLDTDISNTYSCDNGITAQSILLQAAELGYGGCIIASVKKTELAALLNLDKKYQIIQVIALGVPIENVVIDDLVNNEYKYWRDRDKTHHVPKRTLNELILKKI
jgi:Nitroreductase